VALIRGTLDVLILKTLSWTPMHAFEIIAWLSERSDGQLDVDGPAVIQALHRMEEKEFVAGEWGTSKNRRRARYYRITPAGRTHLRTESAKLAEDTDTLMTILNAKRV
jgi:PadR family transcriptional regulator PadR